MTQPQPNPYETIKKLEDQLAVALDTIEQLREINNDGYKGDAMIFRFTPKEEMIFMALMKRRAVSRQTIWDEVYGLMASGYQPDLKIIDVFMHKIRRKLKPFDIEVRTIWGHGYHIDEQCKQKARALMLKEPPIVIKTPGVARV